MGVQEPIPRPRGVEMLARLVVLLEAVSLSIITPMLPTIARENGLSSGALGLITGAYLFGGLLALLPAGECVRRFGPRSATIGGLLLLAAGGALMASTGGASLLVAARAVQGAGSSMAWAGVMATLIELVPAGRRGRAIGNTLAAAFVGAALGPAAGAAALTWGRPPVLGSVVLGCVVGIFVALRLVRPRAAAGRPAISRRDRRGTGVMPSKGRYALALLLVAGLAAGARMVLAPLALAAEGANGSEIGAVFAVAGLVMAVAAVLAGRWSDRSGATRVVLVGGAGIAFTSVLMALVPGVIPLAMVVVLAGGVVQVVMTAGIALVTGAGVGQGMDAAALWTRSNLVWTIGILAGSVGSGWLAQQTTRSGSWLVVSTVATGVAAVATVRLGISGRALGPRAAVEGRPGRRSTSRSITEAQSRCE